MNCTNTFKLCCKVHLNFCCEYACCSPIFFPPGNLTQRFSTKDKVNHVAFLTLLYLDVANIDLTFFSSNFCKTIFFQPNQNYWLLFHPCCLNPFIFIFPRRISLKSAKLSVVIHLICLSIFSRDRSDLV